MKAIRRGLVLVASSALLSSIALAEPTPPISTVPLPSPTMKPIYFTCIDPSASAIDYALVSKKTKTAGTIRIKATVKNIGNAAYVTRPEQQEAQLYELRPGTNNPILIGKQRFQNLDPNEAWSFTVDRAWDTAIEFQPSFRLVIVYDPDIRNDGNPKNDDCRMNNNTLDRLGTDANALFK